MSNGKAGSRVKSAVVGTVTIRGIPHDVITSPQLGGGGLYILRPAQVRGRGDNVNREPYPSWDALERDYPEAERFSNA